MSACNLYKVVMSDPAQFLPILYDPTVGEARLKFGHIFRQRTYGDSSKVNFTSLSMSVSARETSDDESAVSIPSRRLAAAGRS